MGRRQTAIVALGAIAALAVIAAQAAPAADGATHAAQDGERIPAWVKSVFGFYVDGQITEAELIGALQYLIGQGIIQVLAAPAAAPVMSAEATSYTLQAEALEQASIGARIAVIELMSILPAAATHMEPAEYEALQEMVYYVKAHMAKMDAAEAAHIAALRNAAADGTITAAEQDAIEAAEAAAARATRIADKSIVAITPALQHLATTMGGPLTGP